MPLVQEARRGFPLKIVAAILGGLLCVDLIARIPFGESGASSDTAASERAAASGSRSETTATSAPSSSPVLAGAPNAPAAEPAPAAIREAQITPPAVAPQTSEQQAKADPVATSNNPGDGNCEQQTWPYLDGRCKEAAAAAAAPGTRQVRVVGKDSSAPAAVVTPLPPDSVAPRETAKSQDNPPVQTSPAPAADTRMGLAAAPTEAKPDQSAVPNGDIAMPRPVPESVRRPVEAVASAPAVRDLEATPERPTRRDARERAKAAKAQKSERPRFTRSQPAAEQESRGNLRQAGITDSRAYQLPSGRRIVVFRQANGEVGIAPAERRAGGGGGGGGSYFFDW
jgi:hypothetical protein